MGASKDLSVAALESECRLHHSRISRKFSSISVLEEHKRNSRDDHNNSDFIGRIVSDDILAEQLYKGEGEV